MKTTWNIISILYLLFCANDFFKSKFLSTTDELTKVIAYVIVYLILKKIFDILAKIVNKISKPFKTNKNHSRNKKRIFNWQSNTNTSYDISPSKALEEEPEQDEIEYEYIDENDKLYGYESTKPIATKTEKEFYKRLKTYCDKNDYIINLKTRLEDLVNYVDGMDYGLTQKYRGQIKSRHVDYLIVDQELKPIFAIELDDDSHLKAKAKETDKFKDDFFNKINLKLYRVPADDFLWKMELEKIFIDYELEEQK